MYFTGQKHIMNQLKDILPYLMQNPSAGMNMLMRGPSGWGKTRMSLLVCNFLAGGNFEYCLGDKLTFNEDLRVHFIDEVHLIEHPEVLYPLMDSGRYVIVIATNDVATLPEALSNRCVEFIFNNYTLLELREISTPMLQGKLSTEFLDYVIESGGFNPRIIKSLINRLNIVIANRPGILDGLNLDQFKELLHELFGIRDGLDIMCTRYMDALRGLGGTASLQTLAAFTHIDQNTLRYFAEPILLYKKLIKISSKGRSIA